VQETKAESLRQQIAPGADPVWRADGKEILFRCGFKIWSVPVQENEGRLSAAGTVRLRGADRNVRAQPLLGVTRDGSRILVPVEIQQPGNSNVIHI
jgi:hypothetical protein